MTKLISFDDAQTALKPYYNKIWTLINAAWNDWQQLPPSALAKASARTRASFVHDFMVARANGLVDVDGTIRSIRHRAMFTLVIESETGFIALRLKKLNEDGLSKSQPTKQVRDFQAQVTIEGIGAAHHLEVGYVLSHAEDSIRSIDMVCPSGLNAILWKAEITPNRIEGRVANILDGNDTDASNDLGFTVKRRDTGDTGNAATGTD
jgi:hypothetical protein